MAISIQNAGVCVEFNEQYRHFLAKSDFAKAPGTLVLISTCMENRKNYIVSMCNTCRSDLLRKLPAL